MDPKKPRDSLKHGITYTRDFEVVEMTDLATDQAPFTATTSYSVSARPPTKALHGRSLPRRWADGFRPVSGMNAGAYQDSSQQAKGDRYYDLRAANVRTANTGLARELKGRHLQMIAIGGSIGTGLFVASGIALFTSGPASMLLAYIITGAIQFCTMQALGELVVTFPVAGSFSAFSTRFFDPSWGFAMGWNYALQWLFALPLEIIAGALTIQYWNATLSKAIFVTIFLLTIVVINLFGVRGYGEAEFIFSTIKVTAVVGFILLGIVINIGGTPQEGYIGVKYWLDPGPFNHGFKGFCSVLVTATFSFAGTELVGLAAAETANPRKSLPSAIKQVFWRIAMFYIVALLLIGLLVPYNEPRLLGGSSSVDASASPFVIAVESAGSTILPSVMNAVILCAVISVGNSAVFGSSRTLAALAEQSHAPKIFSYVDRQGRPLVSIVFASTLGFLAYLVDAQAHDKIFDWLLAICGLSSVFTWASICLCHIRFRKGWASAGHSLSQLPFTSQAGVAGSYFGLIGYGLVLVAQVWLAVSPVDTGKPNASPVAFAENFFLKLIAVPIVVIFCLGHKIWFKTRIIGIHAMDLDTGRSFTRSHELSIDEQDRQRAWPAWKRLYKTLC